MQVSLLCFYSNWITLLGERGRLQDNSSHTACALTGNRTHSLLVPGWDWSPAHSAGPGKNAMCLFLASRPKAFLVVSVQALNPCPSPRNAGPCTILFWLPPWEGPTGPSMQYGVSVGCREAGLTRWKAELEGRIAEESQFSGHPGANRGESVMASDHREVNWQEPIMLRESGSSHLKTGT